jgi:hypothetical protein
VPTAEQWFYNKFKDSPYDLLEKRLSNLHFYHLKLICKSQNLIFRGYSSCNKGNIVDFMMDRLRTRGIDEGKALKLKYDEIQKIYHIDIVNLGDHVDFRQIDFIDDGTIS